MKLFILVILSILFFGCASVSDAPAADEAPHEEPSNSDWKDFELVDVSTGSTFRISDYSGKPVLVESFAVWCPTCLQQQKELQSIVESHGDEIVHVSLDTDPNEDAQKVLDHLQQNNFDWHYAISPSGLTDELIDEFGIEIVNAPSAPIILVCADQSARLLPSGLKRSAAILEEVEKGC